MLITVLGVGGYLYLRLDDEIRRYAEGLFSNHYQHLDVQLGGARFEAGRGVTLRRLSFHQPTPDGAKSLVEIGELQLLGQFDAAALASGKPKVERIRLNAPRVHAVRTAGGGWNLASLWPPPTTGQAPPEIVVSDAVVTLTDMHRAGTPTVTLRDVDLTVTCQVQQSPDPADAPEQRTYTVKGSVGGSLAESFTFDATYNTADQSFAAGANVAGLDLSSRIVHNLIRTSDRLAALTGIDGKANLQLTASRVARSSGSPAPQVQWNTKIQIGNGRLSVDGLPRPISNVAVSATASQHQLLVHEARASYGKSNLLMACDRRGWSASAPLGMRVRAEQLTLDENLAELLPAAVANVWDRFRPMGQVGAELALTYDGRWHPDLTVQCHNVSFEDRKEFAYRLRQGTGVLRFASSPDQETGELTIDLTASIGDRPVKIDGHLHGLPVSPSRMQPASPRPLEPGGWVEIRGENIPITDDLVSAIKPSKAKVIEALGVKGRFSTRWKLHRDQPFAEPHTETDVTFHDCRVQFNKLPYLLTGVNGTASERDGNWEFRDLVSQQRNADRVIRASGTCTKLPDSGHQLALTFFGEQVQLDDTLRLALSPQQQAAWAAVRPSGRVNFRADIHHKIGGDQPQATPADILLQVQPLPGLVSIEPAFFPYRLANVDGLVTLHNGNVSMTGMRAEHGQTIVETDAAWTPNQRGGWQLDFTRLHVDRLSAAYDLKLAAPIGIRKVIEQLKPEGIFSIHNGNLRFSRDTAGSPHLKSEWNVSLACQQNNLQLGVPLKHVSGIVQLAGQHEGDLRFTSGELNLDSAFWNGMQLTNIRGPIWVDAQQCRLGRGATEKQNQLARQSEQLQRVQAGLYGGALTLDAVVQLDTRGRYNIDMQLDKADLARMSTEYFGSASALSGTLSGAISLGGLGRSLDLMEGGGKLEVRDAEMYELPVMARLLKVLRNRVPDKTAFNGVDAEFKIAGKQIDFAHLNLLGDAVSLYGQGQATLDRQIDFAFHTTVGRNNLPLPVLRSMIGQASANLLLINVTGTVDNPEITREPLPAVNDFVEHLGGEGVASPPPVKKSFWQR